MLWLERTELAQSVDEVVQTLTATTISISQGLRVMSSIAKVVLRDPMPAFRPVQQYESYISREAALQPATTCCCITEHGCPCLETSSYLGLQEN